MKRTITMVSLLSLTLMLKSSEPSRTVSNAFSFESSVRTIDSAVALRGAGVAINSCAKSGVINAGRTLTTVKAQEREFQIKQTILTVMLPLIQVGWGIYIRKQKQYNSSTLSIQDVRRRDLGEKTVKSVGNSKL